MTDGVLEMPNGETAGVVEGPGGVCVLNKGGLSIKRNDVRNLWGVRAHAQSERRHWDSAAAPPS
jgi:hypothetical protein